SSAESKNFEETTDVKCVSYSSIYPQKSHKDSIQSSQLFFCFTVCDKNVTKTEKIFFSHFVKDYDLTRAKNVIL
ncbi:hypothetical protein K8353_48740, partial [Burkholderia contaminans]|nr:hypothetical protein [Burkholderia contaminans]